MSVCSGEGGATLAVVQTDNDKAAMDYFRSTTGSDFWIGLTKKSGRVGITCDQGGSVRSLMTTKPKTEATTDRFDFFMPFPVYSYTGGCNWILHRH